MRNLIMAFACMISISVFGQGQIKLHQASRDSLIGDIDESGSFEIWEPNNAASSGLSYQDAFFNALEHLVSKTGIISVIELNESITKNSEGEIILKETETISNSEGEIILNETDGLVKFYCGSRPYLSINPNERPKDHLLCEINFNMGVIEDGVVKVVNCQSGNVYPNSEAFYTFESGSLVAEKRVEDGALIYEKNF